MPWQGRRRIPTEGSEALWDGLLRSPGGQRVLYVHVPFCANHCLFCGFYQNRYESEAARSYTERLLEEIHREPESSRKGGGILQAVYLGGGTPSALDAGDLARLVKAIRQGFPLAGDCEITLEGRISHFDVDKVDACLDAGVNRISLGVQTFHTDIRRKQGRRSTREEAIQYIERLRSKGAAAVVIDLIFGLPGQTDAIWREDLETALALGPDGVDLYALGVFPGTPLFAALRKGLGERPRSLQEQGAMYRVGAELLMEAGWRQLSNSHFARDTRERNRYNLLIKRGTETLAYGAGAGGTLGAYAFQLHGELGTYTEQVAAGRKPIEQVFEADTAQPLCDAVSGSLDEGFLDLKAFEQALEKPARALGQLLDAWEQEGLLERRGSKLRLTLAGRFWSTHLSAGLCALLRSEAQASRENRAS